MDISSRLSTSGGGFNDFAAVVTASFSEEKPTTYIIAIQIDNSRLIDRVGKWLPQLSRILFISIFITGKKQKTTANA